MSAWEHTPKYSSKQGLWEQYLCPWHDDHHPSLKVDVMPAKGCADPGFYCGACKQKGFGAIQLAARLMGKPAGELHGKEYLDVAAELARRCGVELQGYSPSQDTDRIRNFQWEQFREEYPQYAEWDGEKVIWSETRWTVEALRALGFRVALAQRRARKEDVAALGDAIKVGDYITQYDADGAPLYRCSLGGKDFYGNPSKAEVRTVDEWGAELTRQYDIYPVEYFVYACEAKQGGHFPRMIKSSQGYPIFVFDYPFGLKKYEPRFVPYTGKDGRPVNNKWTWWNLAEGADLEHRVFADDELMSALTSDKDKDKSPDKARFERVVLCSGPRDAMQVRAHTDAHVVWLLSEIAGLEQKGGAMRPNRWLRAKLNKLHEITAPGGLYVCYDEDNAGLQCSRAIALADPFVHWLRLPKELGMIQGKAAKPMKDVTDFVTHFQSVEALMPAELQHDDPCDWFDNAMSSAPTCQFWQWQSERKDADGEGRARYKFDLRNVPVFLRARGMVRKYVQQGKTSFSRFFLLNNDNTYTEYFSGEKGSGNRLVLKARELMYEWLMSNKRFNDKKGSLAGAIRDAKLDASTLEYIEEVDMNDHSFGPDFDHFFFENCAVRVDADGIKAVPYSDMRWRTNSEAIFAGKFSLLPQPWRIIENPKYDEERQRHEEVLANLHTAQEREQENMRFDEWASLWRFRLIMDRPLDEMPLHFRFLYNVCRIFWEKEEAGEELTAAERQMQDMYFVTMVHGLGSALIRHRTPSRQEAVYFTDNYSRRFDLSYGGTGKTAVLELLALMRPMLKIDGHSLEGGNISLTQELSKVTPGKDSLVGLDETPKGFSFKTLYNYMLTFMARGLYKESIKLEGDDVPKWVIASNDQPDFSSESTLRRIYLIYFSNYYHPRSIDGARSAHTPADDFWKSHHVKEVARNLTPALLNEARNLMAAFVQFFFRYPDETIRPPKDERAMFRQALASSKDKQFTEWAAQYIGQKKHRGIPIAQRELAISLLDYCGIAIGEKTVKAAYKRIRDNLDDYLRSSYYVCNPPIVLLTSSDCEKGRRQCAAWQYPRTPDGYGIATDSNGRRLPRELVKKAPYPPVFYFYRKSEVPSHRFDPAFIGNKNYVQPAPEKDPDADNSA